MLPPRRSPSSSISSWCRPAPSAAINDAGREHGQIRAFNNRTFDVAKAVPTVVMRNEDYGRISRIMADGAPVELELNIVNRTYPKARPPTTSSPRFPAPTRRRKW